MDKQREQQIGQALLVLAQRAGTAIMAVQRSLDFYIEHKADKSPVTEADMAAHRILAEELPSLLPVPVVSEEDRQAPFSERREWHYYWLIDPLDGTKEFIAGSNEFCINIALIRDHQPYLGLVHLPATGEMYLGSAQLGAWKYHNSQAQAIRTRRLTPSQPLVAVTSHRHGKEAAESLLERVTRRWPGPVDRQPLGSALKICRLAEGLADIYPRLGPTSEWDTGAPHAILNAAGGALVTTHFQPLEYNRQEGLINPDFYALGDPGFDWAQLLRE